MPIAQTISVSGSIGGTTYQMDADGTSGGAKITVSLSLAPAKAGTLTVRTDANTGTLTMTDADHGITTGARLDLYWDGGMRRGITVGTVSGVTVPIDLGDGDDLPTVATVITAMVPTLWNEASFAEANVVAIGMSAPATEEPVQVSLGTGSYTEGAAVTLNGATYTGPTLFWSSVLLGTSPIAAATTISEIYVSHGDSANTVIFTAEFLIP